MTNFGTVTFTKTFVGGNLAGLTYPETLNGVSTALVASLRADAVSGRVIKPCAGSQAYTVSNVQYTGGAA